jgi:hypothetical protein
MGSTTLSDADKWIRMRHEVWTGRNASDIGEWRISHVRTGSHGTDNESYHYGKKENLIHSRSNKT